MNLIKLTEISFSVGFTKHGYERQKMAYDVKILHILQMILHYVIKVKQKRISMLDLVSLVHKNAYYICISLPLLLMIFIEMIES